MVENKLCLSSLPFQSHNLQFALPTDFKALLFLKGLLNLSWSSEGQQQGRSRKLSTVEKSPWVEWRTFFGLFLPFVAFVKVSKVAFLTMMNLQSWMQGFHTFQFSIS